MNLCAAASPATCTYTTTTSYRANGQPYQVTLPAAADLGSEKLTIGYTDVGDPGALLSPAQIYVDSVAYNKLGQLTQRQLGRSPHHRGPPVLERDRQGVAGEPRARRGDLLRTAAGQTMAVIGLDPRSADQGLAYNLTVAGIDTYYVLAGNTPVLVHNTGPCKAALKKFPDLSHLEGASPEEVLDAIPDHWTVGDMKKPPPGGGIKFTNPNAPGQSIIYETGWPGHPDPVHRGPYLRVNDGAGYATRIPLAGNPDIMLREMRSQGLIQ